jgi:hypothetical protein
MQFLKRNLGLQLSGRLIAATVGIVMRVCLGRSSDGLITHVPVHGKVFKSPALRLRDKKGGEDTSQHESREDLHDVVEPRVLVRRLVFGVSAAYAERSNGTLRDDRADLARRSGDTVGGGTVACREALARYDEGGGVGTPIEEELDQDVDGQLRMTRDLVECKTPDGKKDSENNETSELERLAANCVNGGNGEPVTWDSASADENAVSSGKVVQAPVDGLAATVSNGTEDGSGVQAKTVESNLRMSVRLSDSTCWKTYVKDEPGHGSAKEDLAVPDLAVEAEEVLKRSLGDIELGACLLTGGNLRQLVGVSVTVLAGKVLLGVLIGLLNITGDVESVTGGFGDGEAEVQSDAGWHNTDTNQSTPHSVDGDLAFASAGSIAGSLVDLVLEAGDKAQHDESTTKLTESLHGEDGTHHGTSPLGGSKLGGDDGRQGVVTTDT